MINAKRVKSLRKTVRQYLSHLPKVAYKTFLPHSVSVPDYARGLMWNGLPHMKLVDGVTPQVLDRQCQRCAYKAAKRHIAGAA